MALTNFSLPFGAPQQTWNTLGPIHVPVPQQASAVNNLLYSPADHQESSAYPPPGDHSNYYKNNPYAPPQQHSSGQQQQYRTGRNNNYLPPPPPSSAQQQPQSQLGFNNQQPGVQYHQSQQQHQYNNNPQRSYGEGSYSNISPSAAGGLNINHQAQSSPGQQQQQQGTHQYYNNGNEYSIQQSVGVGGQLQPLQPTTTTNNNINPNSNSYNNININRNNPANNNPQFNNGKPPGFVKVKPSSLTEIHPVLDYDDDEYYDDDDASGNDGSFPGGKMPTVTPIQGPIFLKNGTVPVVPLFSYPTLNNGTFVQIPIWWTALSLALGFDIRGEIIRGVPCVKKNHQLFCPTAGNTYPLDRIESFIDDNKALMRRMYGDFEMTTQYGPPLQRLKKKRSTTSMGADEDFFDDIPGIPDMIGPAGSGADPVRQEGDSYFNKFRGKRQNTNNNFNRNRAGATPNPTTNAGSRNQSSQRLNPGPTNTENTGRVDACESKVEIVTPYWASNSAGKIRAIVNTQHFEQAIHQEVCTKAQTNRCGGDCGCEQKYKWHRLLAYDPDNDCKGIFMDWFLFPSCCVCRCNP